MKHNKLFLLFALIILGLSSCSKEEVGPASQMEVNGESFPLSIGIIQDNGTDLTGTVHNREYELALTDGPEGAASNYIGFAILSKNTSRLEEGTYSYSYQPEAGEFTEVVITSEFKYDSKGVATSGLILNEGHLDKNYDNKIVVGKSGDNKSFKISLRFIKDSVPYEVNVTFTKSLSEGYVYY